MFHESLLSFTLGLFLPLCYILLPPPLAVYYTSLTLFHLTEHLLTALHNPENANIDSFLINHSAQYTLAHIFALTEYLFYKRTALPNWVGICITLVGYLLRACAIHTAGKAFDHQVQETRKVGHKLVTDGVYSYIRHPSYTGFLLFSVGTQIGLMNYYSIFIFACALIFWFNKRCQYEEFHLIQMFGDEYTRYKKHTWSGIPFHS